MKLRVTVTQEDIDAGRPGGEVCAIANAVYRLFERKLHVCFNSICEPRQPTYTTLGPTLFKFPVWVTAWIQDFDMGKTVQPITFEIEPIGTTKAKSVAEEMVAYSEAHSS